MTRTVTRRDKYPGYLHVLPSFTYLTHMPTPRGTHNATGIGQHGQQLHLLYAVDPPRLNGEASMR